MASPSNPPTQAFASKLILVTGAANGIGRATAEYLAARGASLGLLDISGDRLSSLVEELKVRYPERKGLGNGGQWISGMVVDVTDAEAVEKWVKTAKEQLGGGIGLYGCVNNAGIIQATPLPIHLTPTSDFERVVSTNLGGVFNCLRAELSALSDGGSIVNVASVSALFGAPYLAAYTASKHAVVGLTKVAAMEAGERGVRVNAVCPGFTDTQIVRTFNEQTAGAFTPDKLPQLFKRYAEPEEIAALIGFLLGDESKFITKAVYSVDGGFAG